MKATLEPVCKESGCKSRRCRAKAARAKAPREKALEALKAMIVAAAKRQLRQTDDEVADLLVLNNLTLEAFIERVERVERRIEAGQQLQQAESKLKPLHQELIKIHKSHRQTSRAIKAGKTNRQALVKLEQRWLQLATEWADMFTLREQALETLRATGPIELAQQVSDAFLSLSWKTELLEQCQAKAIAGSEEVTTEQIESLRTRIKRHTERLNELDRQLCDPANLI